MGVDHVDHLDSAAYLAGPYVFADDAADTLGHLSGRRLYLRRCMSADRRTAGHHLRLQRQGWKTRGPDQRREGIHAAHRLGGPQPRPARPPATRRPLLPHSGRKLPRQSAGDPVDACEHRGTRCEVSGGKTQTTMQKPHQEPSAAGLSFWLSCPLCCALRTFAHPNKLFPGGEAG